MNRAIKILIILAVLMGVGAGMAAAVETAPRISDREIIESLATLKQGQININNRFGDINNRFGDINRRIDGLRHTMLMLFGAIITLIIALFGYIAWDRRTALKPLQTKIERLEYDLLRDLDIQHKDGSRLTRLVQALRELAKTDVKIAEVLRSFSLL